MDSFWEIVAVGTIFSSFIFVCGILGNIQVLQGVKGWLDMASKARWRWWQYLFVGVGVLGFSISIGFAFCEILEMKQSSLVLTEAKIQSPSKNDQMLAISIENKGNQAAKNVVTWFLLFEQSLNLNIPPLDTGIRIEANPIGIGKEVSWFYPVKIESNTLPFFVVFQIQSTGGLSNKKYLQSFFLKFSGTRQDGSYFEQLFNAELKEKERIEEYMQKRGTPLYETLSQ